ncbi:uncharacterized protein BJ212DRAFT_1305599 [Suillus subaureus]|uniref:Uncharacterized protein n=1 Tax=Suillus subaureus TaxID=48587 RepID=A0A9P7J126_9AGAM|nr:uncharacterized protein BJ212DRAFT_1305599 [Suillus subaureus]KAG1799128.1 hypothetical protein BJ212DRAFT_1305599 [Suillus subaureus]
MQTDQAAIHGDAPKPTHPHPCPVKKAVKPMETSNSTTAKDKAISAKGKGGRAGDKSAAGANVKHPESDTEDEEQEVSTAGPTKFGVAAGHILHWRSSIPAKPSSDTAALKDRQPSTMPSDFSSIAPSSKLIRGSTVSSSGAPLTPINTITSAGADSMADHFVTLFADNNLDESVKYSQALAWCQDFFYAYHNTNLAPKQLNALQPDTVTDDNGNMNVEVAHPAAASLIDYASDTDMESDLEPPPSMQHKLADIEDDLTDNDAIEDDTIEDDIMVGDDFVDDCASMIEEDLLSSEVGFMSHIKPIVKIKSEPVSLWVTFMVTNVGIKHKAPVTKWTKSSIAHTCSLSSISSASSGATLGPVEVEILPCSAYRIKNLPGGSQAVTRWSVMFIPTLISAIGDQDEVWG